VNKLVRIRGLTPYLARGRIRFKGGSAGTQLLVEQLRDFPLADHDDGPDALEMAIQMASELLSGTSCDSPDEIPEEIWYP
jgi:predicted phage terminase large subunit-like protein